MDSDVFFYIKKHDMINVEKIFYTDKREYVEVIYLERISGHICDLPCLVHHYGVFICRAFGKQHLGGYHCDSISVGDIGHRSHESGFQNRRTGEKDTAIAK